jgi:hypothetical protein
MQNEVFQKTYVSWTPFSFSWPFHITLLYLTIPSTADKQQKLLQTLLMRLCRFLSKGPPSSFGDTPECSFLRSPQKTNSGRIVLYLRFQVLTAASMKVAAFWDITLWSRWSRPTFQRCVLPPSRGLVIEAVYSSKTTQRYTPEGCNLHPCPLVVLLLN